MHTLYVYLLELLLTLLSFSAETVNEEDLKTLVGMGFSEQDARKALEKHKNLQQAVDFLLTR